MKKYTIAVFIFIACITALHAQTTNGSIYTDSSLLTFNGTAAQVIPVATAFTGQGIYKLVVDNTAGLATGGGTYLNTWDTLFLKNGLFTTANSLYIHGAINVGNGTIQSATNIIGMYGAAPQTLPVNAFVSGTIKVLYINNSFGVAIAGALKVPSTLLLQAGTLTTGGNVSISGTIIRTGGGIAAGNDTIILNSTGAQTIPASTFIGNAVNNLAINNSAGVTSSGALTIGGSLSLAGVGSTTALAASGQTVNISGSTLVINSFTTPPTAGQAFTLVSAGTLTGAFAYTILPPGYAGTVTYVSNQAILTINAIPTAFTTGNLVVLRAGSGTGALSTGSNAVYLDEYTTTGVLVRSVPMPNTTPSANVLLGNSVEEGYLTRSVDGQYLTLVGYAKTGGSSSSPAYGTGGIPRAIGVVKSDGTTNVLVPAVPTPAAAGVGKMTAGVSPTLSSIAMNSITSGTVGVGQYVYGTWANTGATVQSITGTSPNITVTLSNSGGTTNTNNQNYLFMAAATPMYANTASPGSAVTTNGTDFWLSSRESSLQYYNSTSEALTNIASGYTSTTARSLNIFDGQLYSSNDYGYKLASIGTGTPTTATTTAGLAYSTSPSSFAPGMPKGFVMVDASSTVAGSDVLYVVQTVSNGGGGGTTNNGIIKYSKIGGVWQVNGGYGAYTDNYQGLTAVVDGSQVILYAVRKASTSPSGELVKIVDAGGYGGAMSGTETVLAAYNAGSNLGGAWRGIAMAPDNTLLPRGLLSFSGKLIGNDVDMDWTTANEVNMSHFEIERGIDGRSFEKIGTSAATGKGMYSYRDGRPSLPTTNYYRLKMVDKDGAYKYSSVVEVPIKLGPVPLIYPNPARNEITITHERVETASAIVISSVDGKRMLTQKSAPGSTRDLVNIARIPAGNYMVSYINGSTRKTVLLTKE